MKIRRFSDVVSGIPRVLLIIDDPDPDILDKIDEICEEKKPMPGTQQDAESEEKIFNSIWGSDQDYISLGDDTLNRSINISIPEGAGKAWFRKQMVGSSMEETLLNIDAMYLAAKKDAEFCEAAKALLTQLQAKESFAKDPESTLKHLPHLSSTVCEIARKQNKKNTFKDLFAEYDDNKKNQFLMGAVGWITSHISEL